MTDLPLVYTILPLLALSLVETPLAVVGFAGYRLTGLNDIAIVKMIQVGRRS